MPRANRSAPRERSGEERERARLERTRRRQQRAPELSAQLPPADAAGAREQGAHAREQVPGAGLPSDEPRRATGRGRLRSRAPGRAKWVRRTRVAALLALLVAGFLVWFLISLFQPFAGAGSGRVIVSIPRGASASQIGSILARRGVVSSAFFFEVRALIEGRRGDLHSGRFALKHHMSYGAAIDALSKPPPSLIAIKLVIPEGYTRMQIARLAQEDDLAGDYLRASQSSGQLSPTRYGAPRATPNLEGFLFPATYDLSAGLPVARLVAQQLSAFRERFGSAQIRRARALGITPYELLTVASMIEREARTPRDRPLIAAVIYNRLRRGMPLGVDATIYYALALRDGVSAFERQLTEADLRVDSPYNTRIRKGLPPTPISNPGLASIEAAAHPAHVRYLYYVAAPDGCGEHVFTATLARFQADVAAYDAALRRGGGHLPACRHR